LARSAVRRFRCRARDGAAAVDGILSRHRPRFPPLLLLLEMDAVDHAAALAFVGAWLARCRTSRGAASASIAPDGALPVSAEQCPAARVRELDTAVDRTAGGVENLATGQLFHGHGALEQPDDVSANGGPAGLERLRPCGNRHQPLRPGISIAGAASRAKSRRAVRARRRRKRIVSVPAGAAVRALLGGVYELRGRWEEERSISIRGGAGDGWRVCAFFPKE